MSNRPSLWLYLHFPWLALEALCSDAEKEHPVALLDRRGQRVELCNTAALDQGVEPGLALATACSICPALRLLNPDETQQQRALQGLALWAGNFSSHISVQPPQGLLLEIGSMLHYFGGLVVLWQQLEQRLRRLGYGVWRATGHTPLAARLLAEHKQQFYAEDPDAHLTRLNRLQVAELGLEAKVSEQLTGMGIRDLAALLALPRDALASRLGPSLLSHLDRLLGKRPDPQPLFQPPPEFSQRLEFNSEIIHSQGLLFPLRRLLEPLQGYLYSRSLLALELQLSLIERDGGQVELKLGHSAGERASETWLELCRLRLEQLTLAEPVVAMQLQVERFREPEQGMVDLFAQKQARDTPAQLLSRLQMRLGDKAVRGLELCADHRPEHSWRPCEPGRSTALSVPDLPRPHWLLPAPEALPRAKVEQAIELLHGPERISSGWWDEQPVRRDYYTGRWPDGRLGWLFRDDQGRWFLHGWYA